MKIQQGHDVQWGVPPWWRVSCIPASKQGAPISLATYCSHQPYYHPRPFRRAYLIVLLQEGAVQLFPLSVAQEGQISTRSLVQRVSSCLTSKQDDDDSPPGAGRASPHASRASSKPSLVELRVFLYVCCKVLQSLAFHVPQP